VKAVVILCSQFYQHTGKNTTPFT